jgi:hypothetical protein
VSGDERAGRGRGSNWSMPCVEEVLRSTGTQALSPGTLQFLHTGPRSWCPKRPLHPGGRESGWGSNWPVSPCWGSHGGYGDTGRFSGDTSVFAHGAEVTVAKTVVDPWGRGEGAGGRIGQCPRVGGVLGSTGTPAVSPGTLQNRHPELII